MPASVSIRFKREGVAASVTDEALWSNAVQYLHRRPFCLTERAEIFLLLIYWHGGSLNLLVYIVNPPLDGIDGMSIVNVVPRAIARSGITRT